MRKSNIILLWLTPLYILLAQLTAYLHEFGHSFTAWALDFKNNPLDIIYGGWNWQNFLFLANIDENVNYAMINEVGHRSLIYLIAVAGPCVSLLIYLVTLYFLRKKFNSYLYYLVFWINLINVRELWAYVPLRSLSSTADIANINYSLDLSPWWIFILITPFVAYAVWHFFSSTVKNAYEKLGLFSFASQATLFILTVIYFFTLTGLQILTANYNFVTNGLTWASFIAIPFILFFCWPRKNI
ncbi:MAG TPA: hypothetical protein VLI69_07880 [Gammaproteobacteria bacterium]|nr:hypothetical protein [Gammaproteobacteria bacterium]